MSENSRVGYKPQTNKRRLWLIVFKTNRKSRNCLFYLTPLVKQKEYTCIMDSCTSLVYDMYYTIKLYVLFFNLLDVNLYAIFTGT